MASAFEELIQAASKWTRKHSACPRSRLGILQGAPGQYLSSGCQACLLTLRQLEDGSSERASLHFLHIIKKKHIQKELCSGCIEYGYLRKQKEVWVAKYVGNSWKQQQQQNTVEIMHLFSSPSENECSRWLHMKSYASKAPIHPLRYASAYL